MATVQQRRRLHNPRKRATRRKNAGKRRLTPKQIKFFGTSRQKAALRAKRRRPTAKAAPARRRTTNASTRRKRTTKRRRNVGSIVKVSLPYVMNPSGTRRKRKSTTKKRRTTNPMAKRRTRRRAAPARRRARRRAPARRRGLFNAGRRRRRAAPRRRRRRSNYGMRRIRRRNPNGLMRGDFGTAVGVIAGAGATSIISGFLPAGMTQGMFRYFATGITASVLGILVRQFGRNRKLARDMTIGGFVVLTLQLLQDFMPQLAGQLPFGLRGMGLITPSSFPVPQVNRPNSMTSFVLPAAYRQYAPAPANNNAMAGLGAYNRGPRRGRMG